jgi:hypothetical protein
MSATADFIERLTRPEKRSGAQVGANIAGGDQRLDADDVEGAAQIVGEGRPKWV